MQINKKCCLINIEKVDFKNDDTGEIKEMCKVNYILPTEPTERLYGSAIFECYVPIENFDKLRKHVLIPNLDFVYEERPLKNGFKIFPTKIAEINLRKA